MARTAPRPNTANRRLFNSAGKYGILILMAVIALYPILQMWITALRPSGEILRNPFALPSTLDWSNLAKAWTTGRFGSYLINSVLITVPTVLGVVVLSCLAGYGISRFKFWGRGVMFLTILLGLTVPFQSLMISLYYQLLNIGLLGTYWAVILPGIAFGLSFGVFLMQSFFEDLPHELAEAGRVDGCSEFRIFKDIMLPLAKPAVSTLIVFQFIKSWNEFLVPLLYLQDEDMRPIPLGLMFFQGAYTRDIGLIAAGVAISTTPVIAVHLIFQRQFVKGLTAEAEMTAYLGTNPHLKKRWNAQTRLFETGGGASLVYPMPAIGYEEVGEIVEIGGGVTQVALGQKIWGAWGHKSMHVADEAWAAARKLDDRVTDIKTGIFSQMGGIALNAVIDADIHVGEYVAVFGQGVPGLMVTQLARANGAEIIAIDRLPARLAAARASGAAHIINSVEVDAATAVQAITGGRGADVTIETTGNTYALHDAIRATAANRRVVVSGFIHYPRSG